MRKIMIGVAAVILASVAARAAAPSWTTEDAAYIWKKDTTISASTTYDSVIGNASPADSIKVVSNWTPKQDGWEYILVHDGLTTSADSCTLQVAIKCLDSAGNKLYETYPDSVNGTAGAAYYLNLGGAAIGHQFNILIRAIAATERGNQIKFNRIYIYKRKALSYMARNW